MIFTFRFNIPLLLTKNTGEKERGEMWENSKIPAFKDKCEGNLNFST